MSFPPVAALERSLTQIDLLGVGPAAAVSEYSSLASRLYSEWLRDAESEVIRRVVGAWLLDAGLVWTPDDATYAAIECAVRAVT